MTEMEFWTKYCRAEYLSRTKNYHAVVAEAAEDEELAVFLKEDDILANEVRKKVLILGKLDIQCTIVSVNIYLSLAGFLPLYFVSLLIFS